MQIWPIIVQGGWQKRVFYALKKTVSETPKVVALTKANVVYIGIESPVNISVAGYKANDISVAIDNGSITGENGEYVIKAAKPGLPSP